MVNGDFDDDNYVMTDTPTNEQWEAGRLVTPFGRLYLRQELAEARCNKDENTGKKHGQA